jgi:hypothetical protein
LGSNNTGATLTATLRKTKPKAKAKRKNRVNSIIVDKSKYEGSGIGSTTLNDGLNLEIMLLALEYKIKIFH